MNLENICKNNPSKISTLIDQANQDRGSNGALFSLNALSMLRTSVAWGFGIRDLKFCREISFDDERWRKDIN